MKTTLLREIRSCICIAALAAGIASVNAIPQLTELSDSYLGSITPGLPTGESQEENFIDVLAGLAPGGSAMVTVQSHVNEVLRSANVFGSLPSAAYATGLGDANVFTLPGSFDYLYAKFGVGQGGDHVSRVWVIDGMSGQIEVTGESLSHISLFNGTPTVPEGGATLALLGISLAALGILSRRNRS